MSANPVHRLDQRLEAVEDALSLAYQFLLALEHHVDEGTLDRPAVSALTRLISGAREHARIVGDAVPSVIGVVELPDDYMDGSGRGLPLRPVLAQFRQRFGAERLALAMNGSAANAKKSTHQTPRRHVTASRRRKVA